MRARSSVAFWALLALPCLTLLCVTSVSCDVSDEFPSRPVFLVCPWNPGGGTDAVSRQMAVYLEQELGTSVNVVNATGGAGVTGHSYGARSRPDGHTLMMMTVEINMLHWRGLTDLTWEDYDPLVLVNRDAAAVFVRADSPWKTLEELREAIRNSTADAHLTASGTAAGGIWHLALAGWLAATGGAPTDVNWIPSNGAAPSITELLSDGVQMVCCSVPEAATHVKSGTLRCLGVMSDTPVKGFEHLPSFSTMNVPWTMGGWRGLGVPRGTDPKATATLLAALERIVSGQVKLEGRTFPEFMDAQGFDASWELPEKFTETLRQTDEALGQLLTSDEFRALSEDAVPALAFPSALLIALALTLVALGLRAKSQKSESTVRSAAAEAPARWIHFAEVIVLVIVYCLLAETLGFVITASLVFFALAIRLGTRPVPATIITSLLIPSVYQLFAVLLKVNLPHGMLGW